MAEVGEGTVDGRRVELRSTQLVTTPTAKQVVALERSIEVDGDELRYTLRMAAVGQPLQHHLAASLRRSLSPG